MSVGRQIRLYRKQAGMTQEQLADMLEISFQAVSSWENEVYLPDIERLPKIAECLGIGVNRLLEETKLPDWTLRERLSDESHMHTMLKATLRQSGWPNAYRALGFIDTRCAGDLSLSRRGMHTACHALALGIESDEVLTLLLLGGLALEMKIPMVELPSPAEFREDLRAIVEDDVKCTSASETCLAKCVDCVFLLSTAALNHSRDDIAAEVETAEQTLFPLLKKLKNDKPEWNNAVYLLRYQALALIETYKRLL